MAEKPYVNPLCDICGKNKKNMNVIVEYNLLGEYRQDQLVRFICPDHGRSKLIFDYEEIVTLTILDEAH